MAFASRFGNVFKQVVNSNPSLYQAIRCMSSSKLFVGGLSYATDDQSLREAFTSYGEVAEARVIIDRETGRSKGFGFVTFTSEQEASTAMSATDGKELQGRLVRVNYANPRPTYSGGYGGGGGGFGSGSGFGGDNYGGSGSYGGGSYNSGGGGSYGGGSYGGGYNAGGGYGDTSNAGGYNVGSGYGDTSNAGAHNAGGGYGDTGNAGAYSGGGTVGYGTGNDQSYNAGSYGTGNDHYSNVGGSTSGSFGIGSDHYNNVGGSTSSSFGKDTQGDFSNDSFKDDGAEYANRQG